MTKQALLDYLFVYSRVLQSVLRRHLLKNCCQTEGIFGMTSVLLTNAALLRLLYPFCQSSYPQGTVN